MDNSRIFYKRAIWTILVILIAIYLGTLIYHQTKELPEGVSFLGEEYWLEEDEISFLYDLTYQKGEEEVYEHEIFDYMLQMIEEAEDFLIVDMFMINDFSDESRDFPELSRIFSNKVREQLELYPNLQVVIITDVINRSYNSHEAQFIDYLEDYGAEIIYTDLTKLRDPNLLYSGVWRMFFQWAGQEGTGWLPNPFGETSPDVTLRSYLKLTNIKANHRKAIVTENEGLITSANVHDSSGFHSNIAVQVTGPILKDMVKSEQAVAAFSDGDLEAFPTNEELETIFPSESHRDKTNIRAQIVTEEQIEKSFTSAIEQLEMGDEVWLGMFYLSDRTIIGALRDAANRGVSVRLILDPNENAFGSQKMGLPNVPIAGELREQSGGNIDIRWYRTNEEQYHSKIAYLRGQQKSYITAGSANFTSRNLDNYNLENNIVVTASNESSFIREIDAYFNRIWYNEDAIFSAPYEPDEDVLTPFKYALYWIQKTLHFTTY